MKKTLPFFFVLSLGILLSFPSFANDETDSSLPPPMQFNLCMEFSSSLKNVDICTNDTSFDPERLSACVLYTTNFVSEAICLKNKSLNGQLIVDCSFLAGTNLEEQLCLLNVDDSKVNSLDSMKTAIEQLIGLTVGFDPVEEFFIFQSIHEQNIDPSNNRLPKDANPDNDDNLDKILRETGGDLKMA